jgi:hypothetical protein
LRYWQFCLIWCGGKGTIVTLDGRLLHRFSNELAELYLPDGGDFASRVIRLASSLVAVESCSYNHLLGLSVRTVHAHLQHLRGGVKAIVTLPSGNNMDGASMSPSSIGGASMSSERSSPAARLTRPA